MVVKKTIITQKELQDLLESDDELPTTYNEITDIPAYQNDNRFDHILGRNKKIVQPPETPTSKKINNEPLKLVNSSNSDNSTVTDCSLVKNKTIVQPSKHQPSEKANNESIDFKHSPDQDNSTVFNCSLARNKKIIQQSDSPPSVTIDKSIDVMNQLDKDSSTELSFFAEESIEQKVKDRFLINKGVLSQENIVCIKCIEATQNNSILIWFINYLLYKDMQSKYTYPSSCLVGNWNDVNHFNKDEGDINKCDFNFEIVIKCK